VSSGYVTKVKPSEAALWPKARPLLSRLDVQLTERCNNNCIHCYINLPANDTQARERELTTERIKEILNDAAALGCLTVRFTGGEPLLRADFQDLYVHARRLGLKVLLFTNATLLTPALADILARIPPREPIEITVYGMSKESYEAVTRAPGSYAAFRRGVQLLLDRQLPFIVKGTVLPPNAKEMAEFEAWAATVPWMTRAPSYAMFLDLRCRPDETKSALIRRLRLTPEEGLQILTRQPEEYLRNMREFCGKFMGPPGETLFSCGAGAGAGCVDAYGRFQMCMALTSPEKTFDLQTGSLAQALSGFFPRLRETRATNPDYLVRCATCFLKGLCEQCPARSWMENGTLDTPVEYLCQVAHAQARYLGLLGSEEKAWEVVDWKARIMKLAEPDQAGTRKIQTE
jgi:radical SAM protein with 4Fe4S-binding SPASM domain